MNRHPSERHTRQGVARGQQYATLDRDLAGDPGGAWAATSHTAMVQADTVRKPAPSAALRVIAAHGCWCGRHQGHDWPGKDTGAPHPR